jgi:ATP-dependent RNA helicase DDX10/DBP4
VHDRERTATPAGLQQSYVVVPHEHKLDALYSFLRSHLRTKCIAFLSSCSQIRHAHELLRSIRPGIPVLALHGRLSQDRRTRVYFDFCQRPHAALLASDVCARGLDFPGVDWVVQLDAPEDRAAYIHRVGRTARYRSGGKSLLFVTPSEEKRGLIDKLLQGHQSDSGTGSGGTGANKLPIKKVSINPNKTATVTQRAASLVASRPELGELAKKAYKSYLRSLHLMPDGDVFRVGDVPADAYARSLGLASAPDLAFLKAAADREEARKKKNVNHKLHRLKEQIKAETLARKLKAAGMPAAEDAEAPVVGGKGSGGDNDEDDDEVLVSKSVQPWKQACDDDEEPLPDARLDEVSRSRHPKKIRIQGSSSAVNTRIVFNDDDEEEEAGAEAALDLASRSAGPMDAEELRQASQDFVSRVQKRLQSSREQDRRDERERVKQKHKKRRLREKGDEVDPARRGDDGGGATVALAPARAGTSAVTADDENSVSDTSTSPSSASSAAPSSGQSSGDEEERAKDHDVAAQEELALSLIRGRGSAS